MRICEQSYNYHETFILKKGCFVFCSLTYKQTVEKRQNVADKVNYEVASLLKINLETQYVLLEDGNVLPIFVPCFINIKEILDQKCKVIQLQQCLGILRDKTLAETIITIPNDDTLNYSFCRLVVETFEHLIE